MAARMMGECGLGGLRAAEKRTNKQQVLLGAGSERPRELGGRSRDKARPPQRDKGLELRRQIWCRGGAQCEHYLPKIRLQISVQRCAEV